jgi:hypothetical protein
MSALDSLVPLPRKREVDHVDLTTPIAQVWEHVRHADLGDSPLVRALFALRTLPARVRGEAVPPGRLSVDDLRSSPTQPGFQVLADDPPHEVAVAAIGKVWQLEIPFVHVPDAAAYAAFDEPGWVKVAWSIRLEPLGDAATRLFVEVRVDATDDESWERFERYWVAVGPGSHFIRRVALAAVVRRFGAAPEDARALPGDALLPDAGAQITHAITMAAPPGAIWPWLLQMGCGRAGFYSLDTLDNGGTPSAREIHPDLQSLAVGQVIPATPEGTDGFEVLAIEPERVLILGGLFDVDEGRQKPFDDPRPSRYWHVTWAFFLERIDEGTTCLHVRARAAFPPAEKMHAAWIRPVHRLMQTTQLRRLAARAEGRLARDTARDVAAGASGAAIMALAWLTPFLRPARNHWGLSAAEAEQKRAGDALVPEPRWSWTHAVEIDAPASRVWPWVAQIGADRGGFYSYQWLENLVGCDLHNAEAVHPEWALREGDGLSLHPKMPPLRVVSVEEGRHVVAFAEPDAEARANGRAWAAASWAFLLEPLADGRTRLVSRFRSSCSDDLATLLVQGPLFLEPVGFAMDRRMLFGIRDRATR